MKIKIGIVGYGNLGKAVEKEVLKNKNLKLIAIFSRRNVVSNFGSSVEPYESHKNYKNKIDIMILCGGSLYDLTEQTIEITKSFDTINSFDTHSKIKYELKKLNTIAKQNNHVSIISCGWDPGIFSIMRALFFAISKIEPICFWGKGISMGHSDAIRRVDGVDDGIQFTIPNPDAVAFAKKGIDNPDIPKHIRSCYVHSNNGNLQKIENEIKNIPNYFQGQPTNVYFVSQTQISKLKKKMYHKGEIYNIFGNQNEKCELKFSIKMQSNPTMTARIMLAYLKAIKNLKNKKVSGAFTPLDIPVSMLYLDDEFSKLISLC